MVFLQWWHHELLIHLPSGVTFSSSILILPSSSPPAESLHPHFFFFVCVCVFLVVASPAFRWMSLPRSLSFPSPPSTCSFLLFFSHCRMTKVLIMEWLLSVRCFFLFFLCLCLCFPSLFFVCSCPRPPFFSTSGLSRLRTA